MGFWSSLFGGDDDDIADHVAALRNAGNNAGCNLQEWAELHDHTDALMRRVAKKHGKSAWAEDFLEKANGRRAACTERLLGEAREHVSKGGGLDDADRRFLAMYGPGGTHNADGSRR